MSLRRKTSEGKAERLTGTAALVALKQVHNVCRDLHALAEEYRRLTGQQLPSCQQQGPWRAMVVLLDASSGAARVAGREWIYTAVSRAKEACVLVGRLGVAHVMARRPSLESRKTFLRELLIGQ